MFTYLSERQRKVVYDALTVLGLIAAAFAPLVPGDAAPWAVAAAGVITALSNRMSSANVGTRGLDTAPEPVEPPGQGDDLSGPPDA